MERVFVVGMGMVSSIGMNLDDQLLSLRSGKSGIGPIQYLDSVHSNNFVAGEIPFSDQELKVQLGIDKEKIFNRASLFSILAAKEAMKNAKICDNETTKTVLISGNTLGGISITEQYFNEENKTGERIFSQHSSTGESTETVADFIGGIDFCTTINTACSSSSNAIMLGAQLIKAGRAERAFVGGCDSLAKFSLNGFNSLLLLDDEICKPFDQERKGLNLGEGAGYLVLESESEMKKRNHHAIAELVGYCNANDAYHSTASSPDGNGAVLTMKGAIESAGLLPSDISFVHAHGTSTENNDLTEGRALEKVFETVPKFMSSKSFVGHTLGAAGVINAIITLLSIKNQEVYPTINFTKSMPDLNIRPTSKWDNKVEINYALSNAFGFGGNNTSLVFSRINNIL